MSSDEIQTPLHKKPPTNLKSKALIAVAIAVGVVLWGLYTRSNDKAALVTIKQEQATPTVKVIQPALRQDAEVLTLPGTLQAFYSATVYARVDGYLKRWLVDIGAPVKSGQLLAEIDTPELDEQLKQAEARLNTSVANEKLAEITSHRWDNLLKSDSVSQQEVDEKSGDFEAKRTLVAAAKAEVQRLQALASFKRITSPFDGIVTDRRTDVGALINAGHNAGHELFTVADVHELRLYVEVPQNYANQIQLGMKAQLEVPEYPGKTFSAVLADNSRSVNENSGTILIQLQVDNAKSEDKLMPGEYGNVHFDLPRDVHSVQIPASALRFQKDGLTLATLTPDNHVVFRQIKISRDLGPTVEIASGLTTSDRVIDNPPDSLAEGDLVSVASPQLGSAGSGK